jgi:hypothetical protein
MVHGFTFFLYDVSAGGGRGVVVDVLRTRKVKTGSFEKEKG